MDNLTYDALGNRVCKIEKPRVVLSNGLYVRSTEDGWKYTYYVYDANGKVMATYNKVVTNRLASNQLGIAFNKLGNSIYDTNPNNSYFTSTKTEKVYELTNHLGNIQATVYDNKLPMTGSTTNTTTAQYYLANVASQTDYYAFGSEMRARTSGGGYRYGMNGKEKDDEISGSGNSIDFGERQYDPRLGRWMSVDPLAMKYVPISPYAFALNNPVYFVDGDGRVVLGTDGQPVTISKDDRGGYVINGKPDAHTTKIFSALIKTQTGADAAIHMTTVPTKIKLVLTEKAIFDENGSQIHGSTDGKGKTEDGYYKSATITVSTAEVTANPNDRFNGFSEEEKINGIGTHEDKHLDPTQIVVDKKAAAGEIDQKTQEQGTVQQEYKSRQEYRTKYGKPGDRDITPNYEKFLDKKSDSKTDSGKKDGDK